MTLDWELYRELFAPTDNPIWGRFPHPPLGQLAERLGVSTKTVWRRLTAWRRSGFLHGYLVLPHPALMGVGLSGFCLKVGGPNQKQRVLEDLELIDGVIFSSSEVGLRIDLVVVADREDAQRRRKELISRIPGVTYVGPTRRLWLPPCEGSLSPRDWSILVALRSSPEDSLARLAERSGLSVRTVTRHLARLRQSHALLSHSLEDWTHFPGTVAGFRLVLKADHDARQVRRRVLEAMPESMEMPWQFHPPGSSIEGLGYLCPIPSAPSIDTILTVALAIPGVSKADALFPASERSYAGWIDEHVDQLRPHAA